MHNQGEVVTEKSIEQMAIRSALNHALALAASSQTVGLSAKLSIVRHLCDALSATMF